MSRWFASKKAWVWAVAVTIAAAGGIGALRAPAQQIQSSGEDLEILQVRPSFYMIAGAGGNIAVQVGPMGAILVNTGTEQMADKVLAAVKGLSSGPIRYIINTSADGDFVGGNQKLSKAGVSVLSGSVGNPGITEDMINNGGAASVLAHENVLTRMSSRDLFPSAAWPTKTFSTKSYSMYLNGEGIQVLYQPAAHTDGDSIVFFRRNDVLVTGDIYDTTRFPVIDLEKGGSIEGEIAALNRLLDLTIPPVPLVWEEDRTLLISGHGRICDDSDLVEYRDTVTIIRDNVQALIKSGMTLQQIQKADPAAAYRGRYGSDSGGWTTEKFVAAIYDSTAKK
jgi:glyoxylase-like metal-dependent hydrolase (beta-lactamase superfamily II)